LTDLPTGKKNETVILGDMMLTPNQYQFLFSTDTIKRHGLERSFTHWPGAIVPYKFDDLLEDDLKKVVLEAMDYISAISCVKFQNAEKNSTDFVLITTGSGCSSAVGNLRQGQQFIKLSTKCEKGNIIHVKISLP
jgi:Astacin (Peptidase family M12A)